MAERIKIGCAVINSAGQIGVVTQDVRLSGANKGRVAVMFIGGRWEISQTPESLRLVDLHARLAEIK